LGLPAVLKTAGWGYDGKGQIKIDRADEADAAWRNLKADEAVLEAWVDYDCEVSVVAARGMDGAIVDYGLIANTHANHILDVSVAPAPQPIKLVREAAQIAHGVLERLDVVGVLCVEFFVTRAGKLLINELAPRPHNSGHLTFDACLTSQFEQQLRAICGLPLGSTELLRPAAMANLLGDRWRPGEPNWAGACAAANVKLHLYGKAEARPGRKMGHLTALARDSEAALRDVLAARERLNQIS
jgi:5-(carboxyamino)imidazole ribonucleotide synthase